MIALKPSPFDPDAALAAFRARSGPAGAVASFVGHVRGESGGVATLELTHYPGFTERAIEAIDANARGRFPLIDTLIIHRVGVLAPGEPIVLTAAAARHRKEAIGAVDFLMDYLKTDAPFWKRETGPDGARWIEARAADTDARAVWEQARPTEETR